MQIFHVHCIFHFNLCTDGLENISTGKGLKHDRCHPFNANKCNKYLSLIYFATFLIKCIYDWNNKQRASNKGK